MISNEERPTETEEDLRLMVRAARLYYEEGQMQASVAEQLGVSRPTVSRLLGRAREEGIVEIRINDPLAVEPELSAKLRRATGLTTAIVVPGTSSSPALVRRRLGHAAARHLRECLTADDVLGVGWGRTLHEVARCVEHLPAAPRLVPLLGGLGQVAPSFQVHEIIRLLAESCHATWTPLYAPALVDDDTVRRALLSSPDVRRVADEWARLTVAVVGIGDVDLDSDVRMLFHNYLGDQARARLRRAGAVGDICMRFFTADGTPLPEAMPGVIGIGADQLRAVPKVIAVAGGESKAPAILAAVRGGYVNVLVTDEAAARTVLASHAAAN